MGKARPSAEPRTRLLCRRGLGLACSPRVCAFVFLFFFFNFKQTLKKKNKTKQNYLLF